MKVCNKFLLISVCLLFFALTYEAPEVILKQKEKGLDVFFPKGGTFEEKDWKLRAGRVELRLSEKSAIVSLTFSAGFEFSLSGFTVQGAEGILMQNRVSGNQVEGIFGDWKLKSEFWETNFSPPVLKFSRVVLEHTEGKITAENLEVGPEEWRFIRLSQFLRYGKLESLEASMEPEKEQLTLKNWRLSRNGMEMEGEKAVYLLKERILQVEGKMQWKWESAGMP